jgi:hypothetical protein
MNRALSDKLLAALRKIDRPGSFCAQGSVPTVLPGLDVENVGPIGLPLTATQAEQVKAQGEQAPYGKGTETFVDTSVRKVWRLAPGRFALKNPDWDKLVKILVGKVREELGLEKQRHEDLEHLAMVRDIEAELP